MNLDRELAFFWDSNVERFDNQCKVAIEHYTKLETGKKEPEIQNLFIKYYSTYKNYSEKIKDALEQVSNLKLSISNGIPDPEALKQFSEFKKIIENSVRELDGIVQQIWQIIPEYIAKTGLSDDERAELLSDGTMKQLETFWTSHQKIMNDHCKNVKDAAYEKCTQIELSQFKKLEETYNRMKDHYENDIKRKISSKRLTVIKQVETAVRELYDFLDNMHKTARIEYTKPWIFLYKQNVIGEEDPNPYSMLELDTIWKSNKNRIEESYTEVQENYLKEEFAALGEEDKKNFIDANDQYLRSLKSAEEHIQSNLCNCSKYKQLKDYITETTTELDGYVATMVKCMKIETSETVDNDLDIDKNYMNIINDWAKELKKIIEKHQKISKYFYDETCRDLQKFGHLVNVDVVAEIGKIEQKFNICVLRCRKDIEKPQTITSMENVLEIKKEIFKSQTELRECIQTLTKEYADLKKLFYRR